MSLSLSAAAPDANPNEPASMNTIQKLRMTSVSNRSRFDSTNLQRCPTQSQKLRMEADLLAHPTMKRRPLPSERTFVPIGRHQPSVVAEQLQLAAEMMRVD